MRQNLIIAVMCCLIFVISDHKVNAQQVEFSSTVNPVGSGARATGMGGAFIGVADDATAASWNPAGLVQLERPEISAVYSFFSREQGYSSATHSEMEGNNSMDSEGLNYVSVAVPFVLFSRNMVFSMNYQRLYEMDKEVRFKYTWDIGGDDLNDNITYTQTGFLYTVSPALAVQVTPELYVGATLNLWDNIAGENGWDTSYNSSAAGTLATFPVVMNTSIREKYSFEGINMHFGFLWSFSGPFTLGGVVKTPFDADLERETITYQSQQWTTLPPAFSSQSRTRTTESLTMKMPASYGLGLQYRHSDSLMVAFDVYRTEWSRFLIRDSNGNDTNPVTGLPLNEGRLKDTVQVHIGSEYLFIKEKYVVPLRFGLSYDPEPMTGSLDDYYIISAGTGYSQGRFVFDASYQYRFADHVSGDIASLEGSSVDIEQHTIMTSGIFYF